MCEGQVEDAFVVLTARRLSHAGAQQVDMVRHRDRVEGTLDLEALDRRVKLVLRGAQIEIAGGIGAALLRHQFRGPALA